MNSRREQKGRRRRRRLLHTIQLIVIGCLLFGIFFISGFFLWAATLDLPDFSLLEARRVSQSTKIYDRTGNILLYDVHKNVRRTIIPFESMSPYIKNATVAIEDERFYQHRGIEPKAILRAVLVNLKLIDGYRGQGGSTITQQVIKNALLTSEKTITRKIKEWILAIKLERMMGKEEILTLYLNEAPYGGNIYGIEEASQAFFGKAAKDITLAEAAYLAALPQAPTYYSPYKSNTAALEERKNLVLKKMLALGSISEEEFIRAKEEKVKFRPLSEQGIRAPHFVMYVRERLAEMYGEEALTEGGLRVITTLDVDLEEIAEQTVAEFGEQNEKQFNATNAALIAIDPKHGEILAMVGSRDYFNAEREGNFNVALAKRQPGSAFKPFVYAAAFESGYTPETVLFDVPTQFSTRCDPDGNPLVAGADRSVCYMPENYDQKFRGPITLRNALAQSINIPAVKLLYLVGVDKALEFAERFGITTLNKNADYGLTLVLGGGEVTLLELTGAYAVFANDGKRVPPTAILRVENSRGDVLFEHTTEERQVVDPEIARKISDILSDNDARAPAFGTQSYLHFPERDVAAKTGTTNDYRDAWIVGYTPALVVGAWAGNNNNTPMEKKVAGFIVAPMWNAFFTKAFAFIPDEQFISPAPTPSNTKPALRGIWYGGETYAVDKISGKLATQYTPLEYIEERVILNPHEILYWVDRKDPTGPPPINPFSDPQYMLWELPAQRWIAANGLPPNAIRGIPDGFDDVHKPEFVPQITLASPSASAHYPPNQKVVVSPHITSTFPVTRVDFFLNSIFLGSVKQMPYEFAFLPSEIDGLRDANTLRLRAYDTMGNIGETEIPFLVDGVGGDVLRTPHEIIGTQEEVRGY